MWRFYDLAWDGKAETAAALFLCLAIPLSSFAAVAAQGFPAELRPGPCTERFSNQTDEGLILVGGAKLKTSLSVAVTPTTGGFRVTWRAALAPQGAAVALFLSTPSDDGYFSTYYSATIGGGLATNGTLHVTIGSGPRPGRPQRQACSTCWPVDAALHVQPGSYKVIAKLYKAPASPEEVAAVPQSPSVLITSESNVFKLE